MDKSRRQNVFLLVKHEHVVEYICNKLIYEGLIMIRG